MSRQETVVVPGTGIEPVRPLCRKAADFKSDVSTNFTTRALLDIVKQKSLTSSTDEASMTRKYPHYSGGAGRSRTALDGFAIHCITALLPRHLKTDCSRIQKPFDRVIGPNEKGQHF
jgi:hypothetical protein